MLNASVDRHRMSNFVNFFSNYFTQSTEFTETVVFVLQSFATFFLLGCFDELRLHNSGEKHVTVYIRRKA